MGLSQGHTAVYCNTMVLLPVQTHGILIVLRKRTLWLMCDWGSHAESASNLMKGIELKGMEVARSNKALFHLLSRTLECKTGCHYRAQHWCTKANHWYCWYLETTNTKKQPDLKKFSELCEKGHKNKHPATPTGWARCSWRLANLQSTFFT